MGRQMAGAVEYLSPILMVAWLTFTGITCYGAHYYLRTVDRRHVLTAHPATVVIIPIRGVPAGFAELWAALRAQTYDRWRLIFAVESETDPACAAIRDATDRAPPPWPVEIVVAGFATESSQLNRNCLAAAGRVRPEDEIVVFSVADMVPPPHWLEQTVYPLTLPGIRLVSAFPLMVPNDQRLSTAVSCAMCLSLAIVPRVPQRSNTAWGGTLGLRRETLESLDLERWWRDTASDDCTMTRAIWEKGGYVVGPRAMLIPSRESLSWRESIAMWRRWFTNVRLYWPLHWLGTALGSLVPIAGWAATIPLAAQGNAVAIGVFATAVGLHHWRATLRRRLRLATSPGHDDRLWALVDRWGAPAWCVLRAGLIWSALFVRTTRWAGRVYRIDGPHRVRVIEGPGAS
jgi:hypothetical protein